jgi:DNA-binding transcriptional ArsR family regulator
MREDTEVFRHVAHYFGLLSDPTRLCILSRLCGNERPVREIVAAVELTQANTSRHLQLLYRAGVVDRRRAGRRQADTGRQQGKLKP